MGLCYSKTKEKNNGKINTYPNETNQEQNNNIQNNQSIKKNNQKARVNEKVENGNENPNMNMQNKNDNSNNNIDINELKDINNEEEEKAEVNPLNNYPDFDDTVINKEIEDDGTVKGLKENIQYYDLIVYCNSFKRLFNKIGWYYKYSDKYKDLILNLETIKNDSFCSIGILGESNVGKTFILNKISKEENEDEKLPSGITKKTYGLSVKYFEKMNKQKKKSHFFLYDTEGSSEPLIEENKKENNIKNETKLIEKVEEYADDMKTSEYLLSKFIQNNSNIIIVVIGQLTLTAQELIYNIKYEVKKGKVYEKIIILHNLQNLYTLKDINYYIDNTLRKSVYNNMYKRKFISLDDNDKKTSEFYYFIEYTTINRERKEIIHLIMGNDNEKYSECINLNKQTLKYINDSIIEVNVNNEKSKDVIENVKQYIQEDWILNKKVKNDVYKNNIGHIFCSEHNHVNNLNGGNGDNFLSINSLDYTYYIENNKKFIIKIELVGANEKNTKCLYIIKKERGTFKAKNEIKKDENGSNKEFNILFHFNDENINFSKSKSHNIKNGIITITYDISLEKPEDNEMR